MHVCLFKDIVVYIVVVSLVVVSVEVNMDFKGCSVKDATFCSEYLSPQITFKSSSHI